MALAQGCADTVEQMRLTDPKHHEALVRAFGKSRDDVDKIGQNNKFSIVSFQEQFKSSTGVRTQKQT